MDLNSNRAEQLWQNWEERRQALQRIPELANEGALAIKREQYDFLRQGLYRIGANPTEKERLFIKVIAASVERLQRQLYPNPFVRFLHRVKTAVYDRPAHLREFVRLRAENLVAAVKGDQAAEIPARAVGGAGKDAG